MPFQAFELTGGNKISNPGGASSCYKAAASISFINYIASQKWEKQVKIVLNEKICYNNCFHRTCTNNEEALILCSFVFPCLAYCHLTWYVQLTTPWIIATQYLRLVCTTWPAPSSTEALRLAPASRSLWTPLLVSAHSVMKLGMVCVSTSHLQPPIITSF